MIEIKYYKAGTVPTEELKTWVINIARICTGSTRTEFDQERYDSLITEDCGDPSKPFDFIESGKTYRYHAKKCGRVQEIDEYNNLDTVIISDIPYWVAMHLRTHTDYGNIHQLMSSVRLGKPGNDYQPLRDWLKANTWVETLYTNEALENMTTVEFRALMQEMSGRKELWKRSLSDWKATTLAIAATPEGWEAMFKTRSTPATQKETREVIEAIKEVMK